MDLNWQVRVVGLVGEVGVVLVVVGGWDGWGGQGGRGGWVGWIGLGGWGGWSGWGGWGAQGCQCPNSNFCGQGGQKLKMSPYDGDEVKPDQPRLVKSCVTTYSVLLAPSSLA